MKRLLFLCSLTVSGCLNTGCLVDASKLAGYSNPKLIVKKTMTGFYAEAGSDFSGKIDASYDPVTQAISLKGEVSSNVSGVVSAEGERADHLIELRKAEMNYLVESQRLVGENFKAAGQMLALAAVGGGEAVAKIATAIAPVLAGSSVTLPGGIGAVLGTPVPVPPVVP